MRSLGLLMGFSVFSLLMFYFIIYEAMEEKKLKAPIRNSRSENKNTDF